MSRTYHDEPLPVLQQGKREPVDLHGHQLGDRHLAIAPGLVLHLHGEGCQVPGVSTGLGQDVGAGALEIEGNSVEGEVVGVSGSRTRCRSDRVAFPDAIRHLALLVGSTGGLLTLDDPVVLAPTPLPAGGAGVELLSLPVVPALVHTAALHDGDAPVSAQEEPGVAETPFGTGGIAAVRRREPVAGGRAAAPTELVVEVTGAGGTCRRGAEGTCRWP